MNDWKEISVTTSVTPFQCSVCGRYFAFPFEQVNCEKSHETTSPPAPRIEKVLLRLMAMISPEHAEKAGEYGDEILEAIRK